MNTLTVSLALQLCIYSAVWLVIALAFQINRQAALLWSAGFFSSAVCAVAVHLLGEGVVLGDGLVRNLAALVSFVLIRRGVENFTDNPRGRWDAILVLGGTLLIEVLRWQGEYTLPVRVLVFTAVACWPLVGIARLLSQWLRLHWSMTVWMTCLMVSPVALTIVVLALRAALIGSGLGAGSTELAPGGWVDVASALAYFLVLGAFNFTLVSLVLGVLIQRLHELSATDQLTGLDNRRIMMRRLTQEHARFLRTGQAYTLLMMDLDFFKKVNDTYGHLVGDQVLQGVARSLLNSLRSTDTLARMGGEEFMLLMPNTGTDGARVQAQRLCERIASAALPTDVGTLQVSMSVGVAEVLRTDLTATPVVSRADAALYQAKAAGRNAVWVSQHQARPAQTPPPAPSAAV